MSAASDLGILGAALLFEPFIKNRLNVLTNGTTGCSI